MTKIYNKLFAIIGVLILFVSGVSCASTSNSTGQKSAEVKKQVITVQRGNFAVSVSVDGNLVMPQAFDLRFGAPGNVQDVLVEEGDFVKAGTILARLDNSSQQLDIKSANCSLQQTLSNLYETIPGIQQTLLNFPSYYPNASALLSLGWAKDEVTKAHDLFQLSKHDESVSELGVAIADLEACKKIFQAAIENSPTGMSSMAKLTEEEKLLLVQSQQQDPWGRSYILEQLQKVIELINQEQADIGKVQTLITQSNYVESGAMFEDILSQMADISKALTYNVNKIELRNDFSYPGKDICLYFYGVAEDKLNAALALIEKGGLNSAEYNEDLRIAQHSMEICNSLLGSNVLVLEHGLSLKNYQSNNIDLAKASVTLENRKDDLLKTVIIAPFDGTVVSVGVKKNDVLSAMTYSSSGTIQLVDTKAIKFQGLVDEIDILKIKTGQKATISVDAVTDKKFTGKVTFISPYGTADTSNVVKFNVTIELDPSDAELKGGLTATADIAVFNVENVLMVPLTAVTTTTKGSSVKVVTGEKGQTEERQIIIGKQSQQFAEVLSGLEEGDKIEVEIKPISGAPVFSGFPRGGGGGGGPPPGVPH